MESIIERLSEKYDLPKIAIEAIIKSMFGFTAEVIRKGELESVALIHLGKFCVKPNRKKFQLQIRRIKDILTEKENRMNEIQMETNI